MVLPKIIENRRKILLDVLKEVSTFHTELSIATGYWDLEAIRMLMTEFESMKKIRLLIGREPLINRYQLSMPENDFPDQDFKSDLAKLKPESYYKSLISEIKEWITDGKLEVKVYKSNFLHAKCYIFGNYDSENAVGIIGSSNFTKNGLIGNNELNSLESDHRIVSFKPRNQNQEVGHLAWFDSFWNDPNSITWNESFTSILESSPVGDKLYSPYESYIKTLFEIYRDELIDEEFLVSTSGNKRSLFEFQRKNVQSLLRRLKKYRVAMLADSVGLGKTLTAINVIKQYSEDSEGKKRVEVICPKSLVQQWTKELAQEEIYGLKPLTLQNSNEISAKRELDSIASVSLFVIDESHNLRASNGQRFNQLLEWIRANKKAHVLLLTATPINNELSDLTNQILLGTGGDADVLKMTVTDDNFQTEQRSFYQVVTNLQKKVNQDLKRNGTIDYENIKQTMSTVIRAFVVRRTRQGIENEYGYLEIDGEVKKFPKVKPEVLEYGHLDKCLEDVKKVRSTKIDLEKIYNVEPSALLSNTGILNHPLRLLEQKPQIAPNNSCYENPTFYLFQLILSLGFIPYRWKIYQTTYYGKSRSDIQEMRLNSEESKKLLLQLGMYGILRTVFFKRLESSASALYSSIINYERKLLAFEKGLKGGRVVAVSDIEALEESFYQEDPDSDQSEALEDLTVDQFTTKNYASEALFEDIDNELELLQIIKTQLLIMNKDDSKIKAFVSLIDEIRKNNPSEKILVFTYFRDTVEYLRENIFTYTKNIKKENSAFVSSNNKNEVEYLASLFSPVAKKYEIPDGVSELNFLVSTDVLSEGQNLQDAGILINYDLHWNPVRMIQRNGRVNRLGSNFEEVRIYNIKPEKALDAYLKLIQRLETRINLIRNTIGTDTPVLDEDASPIEYIDSFFDIYSANENLRRVALENAEKAADFLLTEDEFIQDLKNFHNSEKLSQEYKDEIYNIPAGKWCLSPTANSGTLNRPTVFGLTKLISKDSDDTFQFAKFDTHELRIEAVNTTSALDWLKTDIKDNLRVKDLISVDKATLKDLLDSNILKYFEEVETGSVIGQENDVLRVMYETGYSEEKINSVRNAFKTKNVFQKREVDKLKKSLLKLKKAGDNYEKDILRILEIAAEVEQKSSTDKISKPIASESILFYVDKNG